MSAYDDRQQPSGNHDGTYRDEQSSGDDRGAYAHGRTPWKDGGGSQYNRWTTGYTSGGSWCNG